MANLRQQLRNVWHLGGLSVRELSRRVFREMLDDDIFTYAAALAYYFLFSLFPFFLFLAALLAYVPVPDLFEQIMDLFGQLLPNTILPLVEDNVAQLVSEQRGGLLSFGILFALWTASNAVTAISNSMNRAYGVAESRPYWHVRGAAILLTVGLAILILGSMLLLLFGPKYAGWLAAQIGLSQAFVLAWSVLRWPVILFLMIFGAALVYYFTPDVEQEWKWITPGSVVAVLAWVLVSLAFAWYVDSFGQYNKTYGSIGVVIVLLTWMYLSGFFLLLGGEINSEIEHAAPGGKDEGEKELPNK